MAEHKNLAKSELIDLRNDVIKQKLNEEYRLQRLLDQVNSQGQMSQSVVFGARHGPNARGQPGAPSQSIAGNRSTVFTKVPANFDWSLKNTRFKRKEKSGQPIFAYDPN